MENTLDHGEASFYLMGERAAVVHSMPPATLSCQRRIWWLADVLRTRQRYLDIVPGMNNLTVVFDPLGCDGDALLAELAGLWQQADSAVLEPRRVEIPVHYGGDAGPDLAEVSRHSGLSEDEVIATHSGADYVVFFLGFQPGFAYMGGLPAQLATPRRAEPRLSVPAGSVGIGGSQTGIYPAASPGGWQLIGRSDTPLFDPQRAQPSLLLPGDSVRFVPQGAHHA